jgi:hypothetical protein
MQESDKLDVILAEYRRIGDWINARIGHVYLLLSVGPAAILTTWTQMHPPWQLPLLIGGTAGLLFLLVLAVLDVSKGGEWLEAIEQRLNRMSGEILMSWEMERGGRQTAWIMHRLRLPRSWAKRPPSWGA